MPASRSEMIKGTHGDDVIVGTDDPGILLGLGGDDWIFGRAGPDLIRGGAGDDTVSGGDGNDTILGGLGDNLIINDYGNGNDRFVLSPGGFQWITDFRGTIALSGDYVDAATGLADLGRLRVENFGYDLAILGDTGDGYELLALLGNARGDSLLEILAPDQYGDGPADTSTSETLELDIPGAEKITGTQGDDVLVGTDCPEVILGLGGDDWIFGRAGWDLIDGGAGNDTICGSYGNDTLIGGLGKNLLLNREGDDRFVLSSGGFQRITEFWQSDKIALSGDYVDAATGLADLDRLRVESFGDNFGGDLAVLGDTGDGYEVLALLEDAGSKDLLEILAPDQFDADPGDTSTSETLELDSPVAGKLEKSRDAEAGSSGEIIVPTARVEITGTHGDDAIVGTDDPEILLGFGGDDWIFGRAGWDLLRGGMGDDTISGGDGNDTLMGGLGENLLYGGQGADRFVLSSGGFQRITAFRENFGDTIALSGDYVDAATGLADLDRLRVENVGDDLAVLGDTGDGYEVLAIIEQTYAENVLEILAFDQYRDVPGDTSTSETLQLDSPVSGKFEKSYDSDWYRFDAEANTFYEFTFEPDDTASDPVTEAYFELYDANGDLISSTYFFIYDEDSEKLFYHAPDDTTIFVAAVDNDYDPDDYILTARETVNPDTIPGDTSTTATLAVGETVNSSIAPPGDKDWFRAELSGGIAYEFSLTGDPGSSDPLDDLYLFLYDEGGDLIANGFSLTYTPTADAVVYAVASANVINDYEESTGDYILTLELA